jgi:hypothetical protein
LRPNTHVSIRPAAAPDGPAILALADRLPAFGPTTRTAREIAERERAALAEALSPRADGCVVLVAELPPRGVVGVVLLESRRDYFTNDAHGHVAILAVAREAGRVRASGMTTRARDVVQANQLSGSAAPACSKTSSR